MKEIPSDNSIDSTLAMNSEGYEFISNRCEALNTDIFETTLLLHKVICIRGEEAAKFFYNNDTIQRAGSAPGPAIKGFLGVGAPHNLDGEAHKHRKKLYMSLMTKEGIKNQIDIIIKYWDKYLDKWEEMDEIVFHDESSQLLLESVCEWCEVPLKKEEIKKRAADFVAMIDGAVHPIRNINARIAMNDSEKWLMEIIDNVRKNELAVSKNSILSQFALFRDLDGELLDLRIAASALINLIRPTVVISRWYSYMAVAFERYPENKEKVKNDNEFAEYFAQEVRRFYPFMPFILGKTKQAVNWQGYHIPEDTHVALDVFGTNHDSNNWPNPNEFKPERFKNWNESQFNFIPQGGGDFYKNHRCPGEWTTIEAMKIAAKTMTRSMSYEMPEQDLNIDLARMPGVPESRIIMTNIKKNESVREKLKYKYTRKESADSIGQ